MKKSDIDKNLINENIVLNERNIQVMFKDDPFFVQLYWAFQDSSHYYFVTELWIGGSLYHLLNTHDSLDEDTVRFYAAEILIMIKSMNNKGVIYRDIKPENIISWSI